MTRRRTKGSRQIDKNAGQESIEGAGKENTGGIRKHYKTICKKCNEVHVLEKTVIQKRVRGCPYEECNCVRCKRIEKERTYERLKQRRRRAKKKNMKMGVVQKKRENEKKHEDRKDECDSNQQKPYDEQDADEHEESHNGNNHGDHLVGEEDIVPKAAELIEAIRRNNFIKADFLITNAALFSIALEEIQKRNIPDAIMYVLNGMFIEIDYFIDKAREKIGRLAKLRVRNRSELFFLTKNKNTENCWSSRSGKNVIAVFYVFNFKDSDQEWRVGNDVALNPPKLNGRQMEKIDILSHNQARIRGNIFKPLLLMKEKDNLVEIAWDDELKDCFIAFEFLKLEPLVF